MWNPFKRRPVVTAPAPDSVPVPEIAGFPVTVDVVPDALRVRVYEHTITTSSQGDALRCWSYVSDGLARLGQQEIVFTLRQRADDQPGDLPLEVFDLLHQIRILAADGQLVGHGGFTALRPDKEYFGLSGGCGWLYLRAALPEGVEARADALTAILVRPAEIAALNQGLGYRVAALLGASTRYYPFPHWSDRDRDSVLDPDRMGEGVIGSLPRILFGATTVRMEGARLKGYEEDGPVRDGIVTSMGESIHLALPRSEHDAIRESLGVFDEQPVAIVGEVDPEWDAMLVWTHGWDSPCAIATQETAASDVGRELTIGGSALVLFHDEGLEDNGGRIEDVFTMSLCPASWTRLRAALQAGEPIVIPSAEESAMSLEVSWTDD